MKKNKKRHPLEFTLYSIFFPVSTCAEERGLVTSVAPPIFPETYYEPSAPPRAHASGICCNRVISIFLYPPIKQEEGSSLCSAHRVHSFFQYTHTWRTLEHNVKDGMESGSSSSPLSAVRGRGRYGTPFAGTHFRVHYGATVVRYFGRRSCYASAACKKCL
jgi:hypothetical protein